MRIVLVEPEIPGNTGSIARVCAGTNTPLHLVGKLGFSLEDRYLRRAGLDYWPNVQLTRNETLDDVFRQFPCANFWLFTTKTKRPYWDVSYSVGDLLVFGKETAGLPEELLRRFPEHCVTIPMTDDIRSLNLANAASIGLYEGLRQTGGIPPKRSV
ncbi:MAG: tRNA (cytidine(34)-2'-O)-methyltransferase [Myxococcales bacterium]|nr:tRNA (cytidine(34)-2'-O)-methyltransferase [Myxococcales bacterium]